MKNTISHCVQNVQYKKVYEWDTFNVQENAS